MRKTRFHYTFPIYLYIGMSEKPLNAKFLKCRCFRYEFLFALFRFCAIQGCNGNAVNLVQRYFVDLSRFCTFLLLATFYLYHLHLEISDFVSITLVTCVFKRYNFWFKKKKVMCFKYSYFNHGCCRIQHKSEILLL